MLSSRLLQPLLSSGLIRAVAMLLSATAVGQLVFLIAMPLLTRLYSPSDFGVFAAFSGILATVLVVSSLRYEFAIPLSESDEDGRATVLLALGINILTALLCLGAVLLWREAIAAALGLPEISTLLLLLPVAVAGGGTYKALNYWAVRKADFKTIARTRIEQSSANVAMQVGGGMVGWGAPALALGQALGFSVGGWRLARGVDLNFSWMFARSTWLRARASAARHARFPAYDVPAASIDALSAQLPNIVLAVIFSPSVAGAYLLAERVLSAPMGLASQAIGQVLYSQGREGAATGALGRTALKIVLSLGLLAVAPVVVLVFAGEAIFRVVFGAGWGEAGLYASWLIVGFAAQFIYSSISLVLSATSGQNLNLHIHALLLAAKIAALWYGHYVDSALVAVAGLAVANFIGYALAVVVVLRHARIYAALGGGKAT